jgi:hypothetical protein
MVVGRRRRWWWIAAGTVVVVAVGAFVLVRFVFLHDTTTAVDTGDVLARYRASSTVATGTSTAPAALALPAPGVYQYATTGSEHVDALGGTTHDYPATTTITVTTSACGVQTRWDALQERWNSRQLCLGNGGIVSGAYTDFHRFYGQDDRSDWTCAPPYVLLPAAPAVGASWTGTCTDGQGAAESTTISVMGLEDVAVAGQNVAAVHTRRVEDDVVKDGTAHTTTDQWFDVHTGLLLREAATSSSSTSTFVGDVHFQEQYELKITALDPQR